MISGIGWVSELIEIAGGIDVFPELSAKKSATDRIVTPDAVIAAAPDIIIGSWCGKKFVPAKVAARPGFDAIPAVRDGWLREIKSPLILQPGPAALTDGLDAIVGDRRRHGPTLNARGSLRHRIRQVIERRDQRRAAAHGVARRQRDAPLRRIEIAHRRMHEKHRALIGRGAAADLSGRRDRASAPEISPAE